MIKFSYTLNIYMKQNINFELAKENVQAYNILMILKLLSKLK